MLDVGLPQHVNHYPGPRSPHHSQATMRSILARDSSRPADHSLRSRRFEPEGTRQMTGRPLQYQTSPKFGRAVLGEKLVKYPQACVG